ncbi:acetate--CoA ligase family protein [Streptomyces sp. S.PB5]|uniref:acetate--CoA ligase family protein n=1 Tax=Streptomyces sp. S.PB5 TaxID=3020844 RepID=UPI0025B1CD75|nr:acetate--CoA ligase family protein [Streptomyces sp. S.PB5]MDN3025473.1 acetate--CoA ligase family protein [Streptomyces sp. S.PB5]
MAVVGASDRPRKWGYWLAKGALAGRDRREVHLVNRRGGALDGVPFRAGLDGVRCEHVVVAVPAPHVRPVVAEALAAGAHCATVVTSGTDPTEEQTLTDPVTSAGARLLGPKGTARLTATGAPHVPATVPPPVHRIHDGGYETVRELLASYGLAFPVAEFVTDVSQAAQAAHRIGAPLVLKAMGIARKTEAGGVALHLADQQALRAAFRRMRAATGAVRFAVEAMAAPPYARELIVGVRQDPAFGVPSSSSTPAVSTRSSSPTPCRPWLRSAAYARVPCSSNCAMHRR